jgi:hypothetical protein
MKKEFHHIGIPTSTPQPNEIYLESIQLYITDASQSPHHIEWTRAEPGCPFPEVLKTTAHVAYTVDNLEAAIVGQNVIWPPFEPLPGIRVAFILDDGAPVEYLEFAK